MFHAYKGKGGTMTADQWLKRHDETVYVGIDGEGKGRQNHEYILLAASNDDGSEEWQVHNDGGPLSTTQCLDMIISIPKRHSIFAFSFNYDLTMMLRDLPEKVIYRLFRPELRQGEYGPTAVKWEEYRLNLQGSRFRISKDVVDEYGEVKRESRNVWDIFKFYQAKFTSALVEWKICSQKEIDDIARMKDERGNFDTMAFKEITDYCLSECRNLAKLAQKLDQATESATERIYGERLKLKSYYGAGSMAGLFLDKMGIKEKRRDPPEGMDVAVAKAFSGGRFEHSVIGAVPGPVWGYDISSAYPYQIAFLPCLVHGKWEKTKSVRKMESAKAALVHYILPAPTGQYNPAWGPLPFRDETGNITYPIMSGGGWCWRQEFLSARKLAPQIEMVEAYVMELDCDCPPPFKVVPKLYVERLKIGKEGPGIVLKLGMNSVYGKLAQSIGSAPFQSWIWAGMITSGCRAQLLDLIALHENPWNVLAVATDGLYSREKIETPIPDDTGTSDAVTPDGKPANKPLGGWERKCVDRGVFFARPGIYFPLEPTTEEINAIRARGIGRAAMHLVWERLIDAYNRGQEIVVLEPKSLVRFCGAKTTVTKRKDGYARMPTYGQWVPRKIIMSLNPLPKRQEKYERLDGIGFLQPFSYPMSQESQAYDRGLISPEKAELLQLTAEQDEQPDGEMFVEFGEGEG